MKTLLLSLSQKSNSLRWTITKKALLSIVVLIVFNTSGFESFAQYCNTATSNVALTMSTTSQTTAVYNSGRRAFNFAATAGCTYEFSTCGLSSSDTYLRLYSTGTGGSVLSQNDDFCGSQSTITWTCSTTGTYSILLTRYTLTSSCAALNANAALSYRTVSCPAPCTVPSDPGFGNNVWNVACYEGNNFNTFKGYYTENNLNFNSVDRWGLTSTPSSANGTGGNAYTGCPISVDQHSFVYKRQGFPTGSYVINITRDDDYILLVNGVQVSTGACCGLSSNVWSGTLNASSTIEARFREYTGEARGQIQFVSPPANDACASATSLPCATSNLAGTTVNSVAETAPGGCVGTNGVWYSFVGDGQSTTISAYSTMDIGMYIASGTCASRTQLQCIDSYGSSSTETSSAFTTTNGVTYFVYIANYTGTTTGTFTISRSCAAPAVPPANDACASATNLPCGTSSLAGTTVNSVAETAPGGCVGANGVWYSFVGDGQVTTVTAFSSMDIGLYIGSGSCVGLTQLQCVDNFYGNNNETATFSAVNGVTYYVYVANYTGTTTGTFTISRSCTAPVANDNCANAQSISVNCPSSPTTINGTTLNATEEASITDPSCDPGTINDVWYTFNSGPNTSVNIAVTLGTAALIGGQFFTSCGTEATGLTIGGNAGNCDFNFLSPSPTAVSGLIPNTIYRFRLFTNVDYDLAGSFSFTLTSAEAAPTATITAGGSTAICPAGSVVLNATTGSGYSYQWNFNGSPISAATTSSLTATSAGSYTVTVTNASGCSSVTSSPIVVTMNTTSTAPTSITGSTTICAGNSITLTLNGGSAGSGATPQWFEGSCGSTVIGTGNTVIVSPTANTVYYARFAGTCNTTNCVNTTVNVSNLTTSTSLSTGDFVWKGGASSDYATVANWLQYNGTSLVTGTALPTTSNNVILPSAQTCVTNQPSLGANTVNAKNITIENGATINMGSGTLNVGGDFTNNGTFIPGTSTVKMVGTATQDFIYGVGASHVFYNLTIDKQGGDEVVLNSHIDVTNELRVTNKNFRLNSLNIDLGTTGMIMDEGPGHRIYCDCPAGYVQRTINIPANTTVDPGNLGLTITTNANAMGTTVIKRRHQRAGSNGAGELVAGTPGVYRIFDVSPQFNGGTTYPLASGGLDVDLEFQYYLDEVGSDILAQEGEFGLWRSADAGATWEPKYGTVNTNTKTISLEGWQQFSWVTGGPVENPSALPIELVSFQANCKEDNTVSVTWTTASEHNTSHYVVEKSRDGINWSVLGQTAAAGNSTELLNYELIDSEKANGTTYYRLTQFDNDGVYEVFDPVSVNCNGTTSNNHIVTYPNPSDASFYVSLFTETMDGNGQLNIMDGSGRKVYSTSVNIQDGNNVFHIGDMNAAPGMYYIQVTQGNTTTDIVKHSLR